MPPPFPASAVNTKLDRSSPAFEHLVQKKSYTGQTKLFGQTCNTKGCWVLLTWGLN